MTINNNINSIYTTLDNYGDGRLHVAADNKHLGSVKVYTNCFAKFFANLFEVTTKIDFDGKLHTVNTNSYKKLVQNLTGNTSNINTPLKKIANESDLSRFTRPMRALISQKKSQKLFGQLSLAITRGETVAAQQLIGRGAALDVEYADVGTNAPLNPIHLGNVFNKFVTPAFRDKNTMYSEYTVNTATPILHAAQKKYSDIVNQLRDFGANTKVASTRQIYSCKYNRDYSKTYIGNWYDFQPKGDKEVFTLGDYSEINASSPVDEFLATVSQEINANS